MDELHAEDAVVVEMLPVMPRVRLTPVVWSAPVVMGSFFVEQAQESGGVLLAQPPPLFPFRDFLRRCVSH